MAPNRAVFLVGLGNQYRAAGRIQDADAAFERALKLDLNNLEALLSLGEIRLTRGSWSGRACWRIGLCNWRRIRASACIDREAAGCRTLEALDAAGIFQAVLKQMSRGRQDAVRLIHADAVLRARHFYILSLDQLPLGELLDGEESLNALAGKNFTGVDDSFGVYRFHVQAEELAGLWPICPICPITLPSSRLRNQMWLLVRSEIYRSRCSRSGENITPPAEPPAPV